ncbi:MAG: hypothetical protein ACKOQR_13135 [Dolichospermum sp.]
MNTLLVSLKHFHCENIFKGRKTLDIRKRRPRAIIREGKFYPALFKYILIYDSTCGELIGFVRAGEIITRTSSEWTEDEIKSLCMSREEIIEYLKFPSAVGFGIRISRPKLFPNPIPREVMIRDFNIKPPQHPKYLIENEARKIAIYATRT